MYEEGDVMVLRVFDQLVSGVVNMIATLFIP